MRLAARRAARALSVLGHPALLVPAAVADAAMSEHAPPQVLWVALAASGLVAAVVIAFSLVQVRAGRWQHVDASAPHERGQLNRLLCGLLFGVALLLWWAGQATPISAGLAAGGAVVLLALLLRRWLKLSLHAAFAVFAAALLWPRLAPMAWLLLLTAGVCWSRLVLQRHSPAEVLLGLLAGAGAGVVFQLALR